MENNIHTTNSFSILDVLATKSEPSPSQSSPNDSFGAHLKQVEARADAVDNRPRQPEPNKPDKSLQPDRYSHTPTGDQESHDEQQRADETPAHASANTQKAEATEPDEQPADDGPIEDEVLIGEGQVQEEQETLTTELKLGAVQIQSTDQPPAEENDESAAKTTTKDKNGVALHQEQPTLDSDKDGKQSHNAAGDADKHKSNPRQQPADGLQVKVQTSHHDDPAAEQQQNKAAAQPAAQDAPRVQEQVEPVVQEQLEQPAGEQHQGDVHEENHGTEAGQLGPEQRLGRTGPGTDQQASEDKSPAAQTPHQETPHHAPTDPQVSAEASNQLPDAEPKETKHAAGRKPGTKPRAASAPSEDVPSPNGSNARAEQAATAEQAAKVARQLDSPDVDGGDNETRAVSSKPAEDPSLAGGRLAANRANATQVTAPRGPSDNASQVDSVRFVHRVARAFESARQRGGELQLRLSPPELGRLSLQVTMKSGVLTAQVQTETAAARSLLIDNLPMLRERLLEQNIQVEKFDVDWKQQDSGRFLDHGTGQSHSRQNQPQHSVRNSDSDTQQEPSIGSAAAPRTVGDGSLNVLI